MASLLVSSVFSFCLQNHMPSFRAELVSFGDWRLTHLNAIGVNLFCRLWTKAHTLRMSECYPLTSTLPQSLQGYIHVLHEPSMVDKADGADFVVPSRRPSTDLAPLQVVHRLQIASHTPCGPLPNNSTSPLCCYASGYSLFTTYLSASQGLLASVWWTPGIWYCCATSRNISRSPARSPILTKIKIGSLDNKC